MLKEKKSNSKIIASLQKYIVLLCMLVFVALFVYALIFFTPFYDLFNKANSVWASGNTAIRGKVDTSCPNWLNAGLTSDYISSLPGDCLVVNENNGLITGMNVGYFVKCLGSYKTFGDDSIQSLNHWLFKVGLIGILVSIVLYIYRDHVRKNYYITNMVVNGLWSVFSVSMAIVLFTKLSSWQATVNSIDMTAVNAYRVASGYKAFNLSSTDWIFNLGYVIGALMIVAAASLVGITVYKVLATNKRKKEKELEKANQELVSEEAK